MESEITVIGLIMMTLLLIPTFFINSLLKIKMNRDLGISFIRMIIQLTFVGIYLQYIFNLNSPIINILYLCIMIVIASMHSLKSSSLSIQKLFIPILISVAVPQIIVLLIFNLFIAGIDQLFDARFIIPVGGMLLGNCLSGNIVALNSFYEGIKDDEKRYNYSLMLGASHNQALLPYLRKSIYRSISPSLASMATTGLVALPGMMTGQILAGALPITAIQYQIAILIAIFTAKYFSILLTLIFSRPGAFNQYHILDRSIFLNG